MSYPALTNYLGRLDSAPQANTRVWRDPEGRAQGRYFNSTLTSAFQSVRALDTEEVIGFEGFIRSYSSSDNGLSLWKLLDHAANDDESIELDRLCRMLHAINFFRQPASEGKDLFLSVHARLLAAVESNHGIAFGRILKMLELPREKIVLQLPQAVENQGWLLNYVADNYRRNGFRIAVNAADPQEALALIKRVAPKVVKLDGRDISDEVGVRALLEECGRKDVQAIFKRVENPQVFDMLRRVSQQTGHRAYAQGYIWDIPKASLDGLDRLDKNDIPLKQQFIPAESQRPTKLAIDA